MAADFLAQTLSRATVEVRTTLGPPMTFRLAELMAPGPPSPLLRLVRPRVVVRLGAEVLADVAPAGRPEDAPPYGALLLVGAGSLAALGLAWWLLR